MVMSGKRSSPVGLQSQPTVLLVAEGTPFSSNLKEGIVCSRELTRAAVSESHLSSPGLLCRRAHHQRSGKRTGRDGSRDVARQSSGWSPASSWVGRPWCQRRGAVVVITCSATMLMSIVVVWTLCVCECC